MLSPHETFTKATHLILFLRAEDWLSRFYAARVICVADGRAPRPCASAVPPRPDVSSSHWCRSRSAKNGSRPYSITSSARARSAGGLRDQLRRKPWPRRSTSWTSITSVAGAIPVNAPTLGGWYLLQGQAVAIACTTGVFALLFSRLSGREGTGGKIGVARIECSSTQRQKHCEEEGDHGKRPLAAFHGSTPFRSKNPKLEKTAAHDCAPVSPSALASPAGQSAQPHRQPAQSRPQ